MENFDEEFIDDDLFENFAIDELAAEEIDSKYLKCLKENFGHNNFRKTQWKIISSVMFNKQDNCVVMATGYGKSLCFQFTSVFLDTVTVVVSPLISLMEDQVLSLTVSNIKSCLLGSAQKDKSILDDVLEFKYNLVYVTPEFLTGSFGETFLIKLSPKLSLIAIDEAHCISKWGHDFRSAFRSLGFIRSCVPNVPILAMTATATKKVQNDICVSLKLRNPQVVCTGFDRPNLELNVTTKCSVGAWKDIGNLIKSVRIGSIIVYCLTRKNTGELCEILQSNGIVCKAYHAGLSLKERKQVHEDFVRDKLQVIVATIAFGMGIDKPDVRMVIHYGASKDIESYYQEIGRAGRDGLFSRCYMFYSNQDWSIHEKLLSLSAGSSEFKENQKSLSFKIREYCSLSTCRREFIIKYFEGDYSICSNRSKNCCDNCKSNSSTEKLSDIYEELTDDGSYDFTNDTDIFLTTLNLMGGWKGVTTIIYFLRGNKRQSLGQKFFDNALFGVGKHRSEEYYKMLANLLEIHGYIAKKSLSEKNPRMAFSENKHLQFIHVLVLTERGKKWIATNPKEKILFKPGKAMYKFFKLKRKNININIPMTSASQSTSKLLNLNVKQSEDDPVQNMITNLLRVRSSLASALDVMPYMIVSNKAIYQLAQKCPLNLNEFKAAKFDGLSEVKADKFGPAFIKCILQMKNFIPAEDNVNKLKKDKKTLSDWLEECPLPDAKTLSSTILQTFDMFRDGKSVTEIAQLRHLTESTISNYLSESIKHGLICERKQLYRLGVSDSNFNMITDVYQGLNDKKISMKQIKEKCPPTTTYDMIKYVLNYHHIREHLHEKNIPFIDPDNLIKIDKNYSTIPGSNLESDINSDNKSNCMWESDDILDFDQIDNDISQANISIESQNSDSKMQCELEEIFLKDSEGENELNWVIDQMETDDCAYSDKSKSTQLTKPKVKSNNIINNKNTTKRKINVKTKGFVYADSSSSSEDEGTDLKISR